MSLCFVRRDERVSQRVSVSRALMDTNLEAPVTMRVVFLIFFKLVGFILCVIVPDNISIFDGTSCSAKPNPSQGEKHVLLTARFATCWFSDSVGILKKKVC